ncbi:hypothetical protein VNO77_19328 [Canavalia gladiata]|uniref:Uncharacterized protein n=1 Tax=Canavalia gladiata TaxID=3824 RepID=A0AAN9LMJ9_CANGL
MGRTASKGESHHLTPHPLESLQSEDKIGLGYLQKGRRLETYEFQLKINRSPGSILPLHQHSKTSFELACEEHPLDLVADCMSVSGLDRVKGEIRNSRGLVNWCMHANPGPGFESPYTTPSFYYKVPFTQVSCRDKLGQILVHGHGHMYNNQAGSLSIGYVHSQWDYKISGKLSNNLDHKWVFGRSRVAWFLAISLSQRAKKKTDDIPIGSAPPSQQQHRFSGSWNPPSIIYQLRHFFELLRSKSLCNIHLCAALRTIAVWDVRLKRTGGDLGGQIKKHKARLVDYWSKQRLDGFEEEPQLVP